MDFSDFSDFFGAAAAPNNRRIQIEGGPFALGITGGRQIFTRQIGIVPIRNDIGIGVFVGKAFGMSRSRRGPGALRPRHALPPAGDGQARG